MASLKASYVETPLNNTNINSCVWPHFIDTSEYSSSSSITIKNERSNIYVPPNALMGCRARVAL